MGAAAEKLNSVLYPPINNPMWGQFAETKGLGRVALERLGTMFYVVEPWDADEMPYQDTVGKERAADAGEMPYQDTVGGR